jgi:hypothetical protein
MNAPMGNLGIRFNDCMFSEPAPLAEWTPPRCAGLYVVLLRDANWAPKPFQPVYFGEFGHNTAVPLISKDRLPLPGSTPKEALFMAAFPIPFSTTAQRLVLRDELIRAYNPACLVPPEQTPPTELVLKLDELERRHREEAAELRLLFAGARGSFQPDAPRRRIGFIPPS